MILQGGRPVTGLQRQQGRLEAGNACARFLGARGRQCAVRAGGEGLFGKLFGAAQQQQQQTQQPPGQGQKQHQQEQGPPARGVEFPPFQTVSRGPVYDLRFYEAYPVVEMDYRRRESAYLTLGQYQDGANAERAAFSFTQPVVMTYHPDGRKVMQMMVGSRRGGGGGAAAAADAAPPPSPSDPAVRLSVAGGEVVAVLRFSGYITPQTAEAARQKLLAALEKDGLQLAEAERSGLFRVAQYGQVYTLEERLNEMLLRVQA